MRIKPKLENASIVLIGSFNPRIFQPAWFAHNEMIGNKEAEQPANLIQFREQIVAFKVEMFELNVEPNRFVITSLNDHPAEHIKDLVISCFGKCLPHTPITAIGINRSIHFDTGDFEIRDSVGSRLAPKSAWGDWGKEIEKSYDEPIDKRGGMSSITMLQQNVHLDGCNVSVRAKVEPSYSIENNTGIFVDVNNHFELRSDEQSIQDGSSAVGILETNWETSMSRATMIMDQIMALTEEV